MSKKVYIWNFKSICLARALQTYYQIETSFRNMTNQLLIGRIEFTFFLNVFLCVSSSIILNIHFLSNIFQYCSFFVCFSLCIQINSFWLCLAQNFTLNILAYIVIFIFRMINSVLMIDFWHFVSVLSSSSPPIHSSLDSNSLLMNRPVAKSLLSVRTGD